MIYGFECAFDVPGIILKSSSRCKNYANYEISDTPEKSMITSAHERRDLKILTAVIKPQILLIAECDVLARESLERIYCTL